jgi:arylsulfatase A
MPDIFVNFLIDFITKNKDKPFFAYYPTALAHDVSNDFLPPPPPGPDGKYQSYKELIEYLDKNIGRPVAALDQLGLREKTLILFTADNGTPQKSISDIKDGKYITTPVISKWKNADIPGGKGLLTDNGTHVPLIVNWPGITPAGKVCNDLIDFTDFMPTLADVTGASLPQDRTIDGQSFVPQILGRDGTERKWSYNLFEGSAWIRTHLWKLYDDGKLFDMASDPLEQNPILAENDGKESSKIRVYLTEELKNLKSE